jgi:energy-coupling factor transport system ATP-binding protein
MIAPVLFQSVSFSYRADLAILKNLSFEIAEASVTLLIGQNGVGKSTLLKLLNGILQPTGGSVLIQGLRSSEHSTARLARNIAVTFQHPGNQIFETTVEKEIAFGPKNLNLADKKRIVFEAAKMFGLSDYLTSHPYDHSPAFRKLLTIASAVAMQTPILAFDEPSAGLSYPDRLILMQAVTALRKAGRTLFIITHDVDLFLPLADRVMLLAQGTTRFDGSSSEYLNHQRTLKRLGAELPLAMRVQRLINEITGD